MMSRVPPIVAACAGLGAAALVPPTPDVGREVAAWAARPAVLPFAWGAFSEARDAGDGDEVFARGQQILRLLPTWTDGHQAFACDYALRERQPAADAETRQLDAERRLQVAMSWLDAARATAGRREIDLLQTLVMLPEIAARQTPGLHERLARHGGAERTDRWLAEAERRFPTAAVREMRTFFGPRLAANMLTAGNRDGALLVLETAITRSADVRDRELAHEWAMRLREVVRALRGETVELTALHADPRFAPLLPWLR